MLRLRDLRKSKGITQQQLATVLSVTQATLSGWETEKFQIDTENLINCANYFNVSIDYLLGNSDVSTTDSESFAPRIAEDVTLFPVIGDIAAGFEHIAIESWTGATVEIPNSYLKGRKKEDFIVLKVTGSSMFPEYREGDLVLILKQPSLDYSGQVGAVIYNDECATLKKVEFIANEEWVRLVPINPNYEPVFIKGEDLSHFKIIGTPVFLLRFIEHK